jgi:hypothetical protein
MVGNPLSNISLAWRTSSLTSSRVMALRPLPTPRPRSSSQNLVSAPRHSQISSPGLKRVPHPQTSASSWKKSLQKAKIRTAPRTRFRTLSPRRPPNTRPLSPRVVSFPAPLTPDAPNFSPLSPGKTLTPVPRSPLSSTKDPIPDAVRTAAALALPPPVLLQNQPLFLRDVAASDWPTNRATPPFPTFTQASHWRTNRAMASPYPTLRRLCLPSVAI